MPYDLQFDPKESSQTTMYSHIAFILNLYPRRGIANFYSTLHVARGETNQRREKAKGRKEKKEGSGNGEELKTRT